MGPPVRRSRRFLRTTTFILVCLGLLTGVKAIENRRDTVPLDPLSSLPVLSAAYAPGEFTIADPYAVPGAWYKAQLHTHTSRSIDGKWRPEEALAAYARAGYTFVAITDHDTVTAPAGAPEGLLVVPAEEDNINFPFWPLGQHAVYLFIQKRVSRGSAIDRFDQVRSQGGLISIAHPNWVGNLGAGRWEMRHVMAVPQVQLIEVYNSHSDSLADTRVWHEAVVRRGPGAPVWAVAVDDAHDERLFNSGWTMVKVESRTLEGLKEALVRGSLYTSTGPAVEFGVRGGAITVAEAAAAGVAPAVAAADGVPSQDAASPRGGGHGRYEVSFINAAGDVVARHAGALPAAYEPKGTEGFVRVEVVSPDSGKKAWSQPFWLIPAAREGAL